MLKSILYCCFLTVINAHAQSIVFNPIAKDSLSLDSISYSLSGSLELTDSLELQLELVRILPDSLQVLYLSRSGFDQNLNPTNTDLFYDPQTGEFSINCGFFSSSELMLRLTLFKDEEKIYETYFK